MQQAILCEDISTFNRIERSIHEAMIKDGEHQKCWCEPLVHPDGRISFQVEPRIIKYLTRTEASQIIELTSDWFPKLENIEIEEKRDGF